MCRLPEKKKKRMSVKLERLKEQVDEKNIDFKELEKTVGLLEWATTHRESRLGKNYVRLIEKFKVRSLCRKQRNRAMLRNAVIKSKNLIERNPELVLNRSKALRDVELTWSDASWEKDAGVGKLAGLILGKGAAGAWKLNISWSQIPGWVRNVKSREGMIQVLEIIAVDLTQRKFGHWLRNKSEHHLVDNTGAIYGLVKNWSDCRVTGAVSSVVNDRNIESFIEKNRTVWYSYIASKRNPADLPTRSERIDLLFKLFKVRAVEISHSEIPWEEYHSKYKEIFDLEN